MSRGGLLKNKCFQDTTAQTVDSDLGRAPSFQNTSENLMFNEQNCTGCGGKPA